MQTQASGGSVSSSIRMFSAALLLAAKSMLQNLFLQTLFCPLSVPSSIPSTHQYLRLNILPQQPAKPEQRGIGES
jgi:hypothetical protein